MRCRERSHEASICHEIITPLNTNRELLIMSEILVDLLEFTTDEDLRKLNSQLQENEIVQKEFGFLKDDSNIYKLIGPVLVKQEKTEATENIARRLERIKTDIKRVETQVKDLTEKLEKKKLEIVKLNESRMQQAS
ncbi:11834_t:CDS:2 [Scutellospora calospora]|uniref:11834_t:CDS:1 n=1 Tax=Scutellospora calospora TaxID=85575 RepID=A0ACA9LAY5_9GLOM|nr:11834_t:CDS:2 [Scutellospora calospora]